MNLTDTDPDALTVDAAAELVCEMLDECGDECVQSVTVRSGGVVVLELENGQLFRLTLSPATADDLFG